MIGVYIIKEININSTCLAVQAGSSLHQITNDRDTADGVSLLALILVCYLSNKEEEVGTTY